METVKCPRCGGTTAYCSAEIWARLFKTGLIRCERCKRWIPPCIPHGAMALAIYNLGDWFGDETSDADHISHTCDSACTMAVHVGIALTEIVRTSGRPDLCIQSIRNAVLIEMVAYSALPPEVISFLNEWGVRDEPSLRGWNQR